VRAVFLLFLSAYFFLLALKSRVAGMYTYWWFAIFRPHDWDWGTIASLKLPLISAVLLILPSLAQQRYPVVKHPLAKLMLLYLFLLFMADIINGCDNYLGTRTQTAFTFAILIYVVLLSSRLITSLKHLFWLIFIMSVSIGFHSGKGGVDALLSGSSYYGRNILAGMFSGSNGYALGTALLLFFMIFSLQHLNSRLIFEDNTKWYASSFVRSLMQLTFLVMIFGTIYNIIALESRGSFLAMSVGIFLFIFLQENRGKLFALIFVVLLVVFAVVPLPDGFQDRIQTAFAEDEGRDHSAESRPHFWNTAVIMSKSYPLGVGPGCYPAYYNSFDATNGKYGYYRSVHSSHFQILADAGYIGTLVWILLLATSYLHLRKIRRLAKKSVICTERKRFYINVSNALICLITVFLLGGAFYEFAYNDVIWLVFGLIIVLDKLFFDDINANDKVVM
jgi:putative inorganic carbon (HCO3(-)) transporter